MKPTSFTVILRGAILSVKSPQLRYIARGTTGTFTKYGVDPQEDQLKAIKAPSDIFASAAYGQEPEELYGVLENQRGDEVVRSMYVVCVVRSRVSVLIKALQLAVEVQGRVRWLVQGPGEEHQGEDDARCAVLAVRGGTRGHRVRSPELERGPHHSDPTAVVIPYVRTKDEMYNI